jgi:PAS domain S-box-containing protein
MVRRMDDRPAGDPPRTGGAEDDELVVLRQLVEGTATATGEEFLQTLVQNLARTLRSAYAFVAEFADRPTRVRTLAYWGRGGLLDNVEFDLAGTPCEDVVRGKTCHHPHGVQERFPGDTGLAEIGIESYLGVPLVERGGEILGHLAILHTAPMPDDARRLRILQFFAARAVAELERLRAERLLRASEERFRDLYDEAPIAYIYEDTESRFVSANRAAIALLGLEPDEVRGTLGLSLVAPTPESQARVRDAIASIQSGQERACIELELRRKNDGRPVWVQWWSKPDPDGAYTRTMLVDVTARVLAEQERNRLQQQNSYLQEEINSEYNFEEIIGNSPALRATLAKARQVAPTDSTVLILGETGAGKELIARAVHDHSTRRHEPLIKVNCSALPTGLVESELFGHERGAFTGATEKRVGRFALANGGTIFLDEIGDMPMEAQTRLLRVLQEGEYTTVGGRTPIRTNVRIIAATNRDLGQAIADGSFRADLFYRLNVFPLAVPSLRERREDIPVLVHYFVTKYAAKIGRRIEAVHPETMERLVRYAWPGNIRELQNVIERAVILASGPVLEVEPHVVTAAPNARPPAASAATQDGAAGGTLDEMERRHIVATLKRCGWVVDGNDGAARALGVNPSTLRSRMKKLGIRRAAEAADDGSR